MQRWWNPPLSKLPVMPEAVSVVAQPVAIPLQPTHGEFFIYLGAQCRCILVHIYLCSGAFFRVGIMATMVQGSHLKLTACWPFPRVPGASTCHPDFHFWPPSYIEEGEGTSLSSLTSPVLLGNWGLEIIAWLHSPTSCNLPQFPAL